VEAFSRGFSLFHKIFLVCLFAFGARAHSQEQIVSTVELQWVVCELSENSLFTKINSVPGKYSDREVYYSETRDLDLYHAGAVARARMTKKKIKTAVKIKLMDESQIPWDFLAGQDFKCEIDSYSGNEKVGCSLYSQPVDKTNLRSPAQDDFIRRQTGFSQFSELKTWGPAHSREWEWLESEVGETLVVESVRAPGSFFSLELSARASVEKKEVVLKKVRTWLDSKAVQLCPDQVGKTEKLLKSLIARSASASLL